MNRFIASIFAYILSMMHIAFIGFLIVAIYQYHNHKQEIVGVFGEVANNDGLVYGVAFCIFAAYVLFLGMLSTFVAMNENLELIKKNLNKNKAD